MTRARSAGCWARPLSVSSRSQCAFAIGSDDTDDDEEREVYEFTDIESLGVEAFQAIYEKPNTGL